MKQRRTYHARNYCKGDEDKIPCLFNETYSDYAGLVPRTSEYWLWNCFERPDVDPNGIVIVEDEASAEMVGYAVIGKSGNIWEFCVSGDCERGAVTALILEEAKRYTMKVGADYITLNVPATDSIVEAVENLGFAELPLEQMFLQILDFQALITLLAENSVHKLNEFNENVLFVLKDADPWMKPQFGLELSRGKIGATAEIRSYSIRIEADVNTLTSILLGTLNPYKPLATRKLKIYPFWKTRKSLQLLFSLQSKDPWFFPRADFG